MSMLEELNVQSALEAERGEEERVRDALVERDKMPLVVREAALIELWREEVMPRILKMGEPERAKEIFQKILDNFPRRTDIWMVYVDQLAKKGEV